MRRVCVKCKIHLFTYLIYLMPIGPSSSRGSLSAESIDSHTGESRKKSILKKSDSARGAGGGAGGASGGLFDPECEQLIGSGAAEPLLGDDANDISTSSPMILRAKPQHASTIVGLSKFSARRRAPPTDDPPETGVASCRHHLLGEAGVPTCGCSFDRQAENASPTEETKLLYHHHQLHHLRRRPGAGGAGDDASDLGAS